jgi:hypothetical protein
VAQDDDRKTGSLCGGLLDDPAEVIDDGLPTPGTKRS